jgi:predicted ATPase
VARPFYLTMLAELYGKAGQFEQALAVLDESLELAHAREDQYYLAEQYRMKGEFLLALESEKQAEAESCFRKAVEIAQQQEAQSLRLRAVMSLCRLWQQQGKRAEARRQLAEVYAWFTEGFATADLQEAKALLAELS